MMIKAESSFDELMVEICLWSAIYEISFQFWPKSSYVYVNRDGVEIFDHGGLEMKPTIELTIERLRKINPSFYREIKPKLGKQ